MKKIIIFIIFTLTLIMNMSIALLWNPDIDNKKDDPMQSTEVFSDTRSLCKVDDVILLEELDNSQSKELDSILSPLSTFEIELVKEELNTCSEDEIIKAFRKLKRRLPESEYKKIEEILSPLIDIEELNSILKNKYV